jgi:curved DNA-binding protein CbpA
MYLNMIQIRDPVKRIQIINTCMASMEYIQSAKRSGVYSYLMHYISTVQSGGNPPILPGESVAIQGGTPSSAASQGVPPSSAASQQPHQQDITMPRSLQNMNMHGIGATHPSLLGNDQKKQQFHQPSHASHVNQQVAIRQELIPAWKTVTETPKQKAISYFSSCLEVLGIQEEVALTEETLKKAYRKQSLRAHPDKGGSPEYFEAVTRSYAYLSEILMVMKGGKKNTETPVSREASEHLRGTREQEAKQWEHQEPVRLNAKNLDMNAFNKLFEQTHMPDPDSDGYGDWLKSGDSRDTGPKFKGEFNRDVFNRMFDDEAKKSRQPSTNLIVHPGQMALTLNPTTGVDLVGERPDSYTAAPNSRFQFTDLRGAYTSESTISDKVSNVTVGDRNYEQYRASREKAPDPFSQTEMHGIREFESRQKQQDDMRERRRAEMSVRNQQYHDQMKRMVITDGVDLNQKKIGY